MSCSYIAGTVCDKPRLHCLACYSALQKRLQCEARKILFVSVCPPGETSAMPGASLQHGRFIRYKPTKYVQKVMLLRQRTSSCILAVGKRARTQARL
ncbi:hypothetical protein BD310DRAFT_392371 [Dichomitus squalens]|uniref:Uncharacterized protein n=1 Tax=Dichomitus squalens TaxID=114155 RepID=A0A4Q9QB34_9APHY|nr:hypothetical protein BD310DRAFT_392371 [Dichomitus squalens]